MPEAKLTAYQNRCVTDVMCRLAPQTSLDFIDNHLERVMTKIREALVKELLALNAISDSPRQE